MPCLHGHPVEGERDIEQLCCEMPRLRETPVCRMIEKNLQGPGGFGPQIL